MNIFPTWICLQVVYIKQKTNFIRKQNMQSRRVELDAYKQCGMKLTEGFKVYTEKNIHIWTIKKAWICRYVKSLNGINIRFEQNEMREDETIMLTWKRKSQNVYEKDESTVDIQETLKSNLWKWRENEMR